MTLRAEQTGPDGHDGAGSSLAGIRNVPGAELDRLIGAGADEWSELQDALLATGGMLPSPILAARVVRFFEGLYWEAEKARIETLRRQRVFDGLGRRDRCEGGWALI